MLSRLDTSSPAQPSPARFEIARRDLEANTSVIEVAGELDLATAPRLKWLLIDSLDAGHIRLVVDLSGTSFIDSTALGVLVGVNRSLDPDARLAIVCAGGDVSKIFQLSGMDGVFTILPTLEQALAHVQGGGGRPLAPDAEMVLAIASTAMPFARSPEEQAERWLRVLRLHGEVGIALQALGVSEVPLAETRVEESGDTDHLEHCDAVAEVSEHAAEVAVRRGSPGVTTIELLIAVMHVYGAHFARVLEAHGTDCDEVLDRLGVAALG